MGVCGGADCEEDDEEEGLEVEEGGLGDGVSLRQVFGVGTSEVYHFGGFIEMTLLK